MMNEGQYQGMLDIWNEQAKSIKEMNELLKEIKELLTVRSVQPEAIAESVRRELDIVFTSANDGNPNRRAVKKTKGN